MSIFKNKWFLIFLYIVTAFIVATLLGFILISFVIEFCISIYTKRIFYLGNIDFVQCVKIGI